MTSSEVHSIFYASYCSSFFLFLFPAWGPSIVESIASETLAEMVFFETLPLRHGRSRECDRIEVQGLWSRTYTDPNPNTLLNPPPIGSETKPGSQS